MKGTNEEGGRLYAHSASVAPGLDVLVGRFSVESDGTDGIRSRPEMYGEELAR